VTVLSEGDRVALLSYHAFAEYDVADASAVVKLPKSLDDTPTPGEPIGCALNVFHRADIRAGQKVAVVGVGFLGAILIQLASRCGAVVLAISRRPWSLEVARRMGAGHTFALTDTQGAISETQEVLGSTGCDRVVEATGKQLGLDVASALVSERGRLIIAGYHQDGRRQVDMQSWNWRGIDVINAHERDPRAYVRGIQAALDAVERGQLDFAPLLTHRFGLGDLPTAMRIALERPEGFLKSYITFT
jgi:threonine dehydrogenase-like Zn-dependent dehydrogenase